mmetsp:Transcript_25487/g.46096  ORF Transcript_25487/g.46096 Transcript_25487/m.46096 type:complete len:201 (+) Transcript_25487:711-1313(+)
MGYQIVEHFWLRILKHRYNLSLIFQYEFCIDKIVNGGRYQQLINIRHRQTYPFQLILHRHPHVAEFHERLCRRLPAHQPRYLSTHLLTMFHPINHVNGTPHSEPEEYSQFRPIPQVKRRIFDVDSRHGEQYEEYRPESILELLRMMESARFVGEEVDEDEEKDDEAAAEYGGNAEECQHEKQGGNHDPEEEEHRRDPIHD